MGWRFHLLLRPFLTGIVFGLFITILMLSIYRSFFKSLILSLGIGLIFGLVLLFANLIHIKMIERKYGRSAELLKSHHTRELELPVPYDKAFDLCINAVKSLKKCEIQESNRHLGRIVAIKPSKVPLDWIYNRDLITIELRRIDDGKTNVKISSRLFPQPPSEYYVDYGSNLENVEKISEMLENYIKKYAK